MAKGARRGVEGRIGRIALAALGLVLAPAPPERPARAQAAPAVTLHLPAEGWRDAAARDLAGVHDALAANGPFMVVDRDGAGARRWLDAGLVESRRALPRVHDGRTYLMLLKRYAGGFRDGHISVHPGPQDILLDPLRWPGFAMVWRDGGYQVGWVLPAAATTPPVGARLVGCDGRSAEAVARQQLDRVRGDLDLEAARVHTAGVLLWDFGDPEAPTPGVCSFRTSSGEARWPLVWRPWAAAETATGLAALGEPAARFGVDRWGANAWWIGAPTMTGEADWKTLYDKVDANLGALRKAAVIVIDLRGNGGGDSDFGVGLAERLWGEALVDAHSPPDGDLVFKNGPLSREWAAGALKFFVNHPQELEAAKRLVVRLDKAQSGSKVVIAPDAAPPPATPPDNPVRGTVIVLVDHACFSACLDTLDLFTRMPGVRLAGTRTGADTIFMDVMQTPLPSGRSVLGFGIKAWSQRLRASNVPYTPSPDLRWTGALSDQAGLKRWLAERLGVQGS